MGYALTYPSKYYVPTDDSIIENSVAVNCPDGAYTKKKEYTLTEDIHPESRFRFVMELKSGAAGGGNWCYGRVYKNDVAIGTEYGDTSGAFQTFTEDIDVGNWKKGDTVSLWCRCVFSVLAQCRLFRLAGIGSEWVKTLP